MLTCRYPDCDQPRHVTQSGRRITLCREHMRAYSLARYHANPEAARASTARWRQRNIERRRDYQRRWRATNPEREREITRQWRERPGNREKVRNAARSRKYGVSLDWFRDQLVGQAGRCAICIRVFPTNAATHIDHDHATGKARGLLCSDCNTLLGLARDSATVLTSAVRYLAE